MKIGFDAKRLYNNFTGLGNHSRTTIDILTAEFPDNEYWLYTPKVRLNGTTQPYMGKKNCYTVTPKGVMRGSAWRTYGLVNEMKKDGIEVFHGLSNEMPVGLFHSGIASVVTIHDVAFKTFPDMYHWHDRKIYDMKWQYACNHADRIICISECTKKDVLEFYNVPDHKVEVIYQPVNPIYYTPIAKSETQPYMLYVGAINSRKNLFGIVKAMELMPEDVRMPLIVVGGGGSYKPPIGDNTGNDTPEDEPVALAVDTPNIYANTNTIAYGDDAVFNIRNLNAVGLETDNYYVLHIMIPEGVQVRSISFPGFGSSVKVSLAYQSGSTELGNYVSNDSVALTERQGSNLRYIAFQMRGVTEVKPDGEITIMLKNISARDRVATLQAILSARDAKTKVLEQHYDKYNIALAGPKTNTTSGTTGGTGSATGSGTTDTTGTATDGYTPATTVRANNLSRPFILLTSPDGLVTDILIEPVFDYVSTEMNMYNTYPLMLPLDENAPAPAAVDTGAENSIGASPVTNDTIRAFVHMMNLRHMMREEFALQKSQSLMTRILRANRQK